MSKKNVSYIYSQGVSNDESGARESTNIACCDIERENQVGYLRLKIQPDMDEKSFVRAAWIYLTKMDVPFDVFDCELERVEVVEHQVMIDAVKFKVDCDASYSKNGLGRSMKSECIVKSTVCAENGKGRDEIFTSGDESFGLGEEEKNKATISFDASAFLECYESMNADSVFPADTYEAERMDESEECKGEVAKKHKENISEAVGKALGEKYQIVECGAKPLERSTRMYMTPECYTTITYRGKIYTLRVFPFGDAEVSGDKIENDHSLRAYVDKRQEELNAERKMVERSAAGEKSGWSKTPFVASAVLFALFIAGFIALSLVYAFNGALSDWNAYSIGMLVGAVAAVLLFAGAVSTFAVNVALKARRDRAIDAKAQVEIEEKENEVTTAIEKFSASYKARQLELLNEKLEFLGLEPATAEELDKPEN